MKLRESIIEHHLRGVTNVIKNQFGFMPRRSTMEAIILITVVDLRLDLREDVLTEAMNNGTRETRGFRQVRASLWIITLRPMCVVV
jgi:hypothetical protein